jgi:hypothetical protein
MSNMAVQLLRVFFPDTMEYERRKLAAAAPLSISPVASIFGSIQLDTLLQIFDTYLPQGHSEYIKPAWESVRQLLGALGFGDLKDSDSRNAHFDALDVNRDGKVHFSP